MKQFYETQFFPELRRRGIDTVIHLGDIFDRRKYINYKTLHAARDFFFEPMREFKMHLLVGNHDTAFKNTNEVNSPDLLLRDYPNINCIEAAEDIVIDGTVLGMLPWVCSDNYAESMEYLQSTKAQLLFGHLEIRGFEMHAGHSSNTGFDPSVFDKFHTVFSGHFHHKSNNGNITYLGAPYEMTWSDYNDPRGWHILDTDTRQIEFIPNNVPVFYRLVYDDRKESSRDLFDGDLSFLEDKYVKVVVESREDSLMWAKRFAKVLDQKPADTVLDDRSSLVYETDDADIGDEEDIIKIVTTMVEASTLTEESKHRVIGLMEKLHIEAQQRS